MITKELEAAYSYWRVNPIYVGRGDAQGRRAMLSLDRARQDIAAGVKRYAPTTGNTLGTATDDGLRWCENPEAIGLRFVGFAGDVMENRVMRASADYAGYCGNPQEFDGEIYRGAVYQLSARNGCPIYVAGYREGAYSNNGRAWSDTNGNPAARLDLATLYHGNPGENKDCDAARDAAVASDRIAEREAETQRTYNETWEAGTRYSAFGDDIQSARRTALQLIREIKASRPFGETICKTLRAAFNDGAGENVFAVRS